MEEECKPKVQPQRRLNPSMKEVVKAEVIKLLDAGMIYPIFDSAWVSPVQVVPKKGGMTVIKNKKNELIPTRKVTGWRVCIDYRKLNDATRKVHFPLPFIDQMIENCLDMSIIVFFMVILDIIKYLWHLKTKKIPHSHAFMVHLHIGECLLVYVMPLLHSKDA